MSDLLQNQDVVFGFAVGTLFQAVVTFLACVVVAATTDRRRR